MNSWQSSAFFWSLSLGLRLHRVSLGYMGLILSSRPSIRALLPTISHLVYFTYTI